VIPVEEALSLDAETSHDGSDITEALLSDLRLRPVDLDLTLTRRRPDLLTWLFLQQHANTTWRWVSN